MLELEGKAAVDVAASDSREALAERVFRELSGVHVLRTAIEERFDSVVAEFDA